jgi:SAM-dependent methyltransferase
MSVFKFLPPEAKILVRKIIFYGNKQYCNVCNSSIKRFLPGGIYEEVIEKLEIIGGGYHEFDYCPVCKASYRQRLVKAFLDDIGEPTSDKKLLLIAPEESLHNIFKKKLGKNYVCGDLLPERYSYYAKPMKIDLTSIEFANNSFDIIICNHVLEHIPDDRKAMQEILRVLKPSGFAMLQVPVSLKLKETFEDWTITTPEDRLKNFGQKDHVRVYSMDYVDRLKSVGFQVEVIPSLEYKHLANFDKLMLDMKEQLFVARKNK